MQRELECFADPCNAGYVSENIKGGEHFVAIGKLMKVEFQMLSSTELDEHHSRRLVANGNMTDNSSNDVYFILKNRQFPLFKTEMVSHGIDLSMNRNCRA